LITLKNIENELTETEKNKLGEDLGNINASISRIRTFVNELIHLQNAETVSYFEGNKMIKTN